MNAYASSFAIFSLLIASSFGATILTYTSSASTTSATLAAGNVDSNVSADLLAAGGGLTANAGTTWNWNAWNTASTSASAAITAGDFWSWGFDVTGNVTIDLTALDIRYDRSGTGPDDVEITVSVNGGTAAIVHTHNFNDSDVQNVVSGLDLSSLQDLNQGDSVVFTFAAFNSEAAGGTFDLENHTSFVGGAGLVISGNITAIPESTPALLGALGLFGILRRRR